LTPLIQEIRPFPGLYAVRGWIGCCHALVENDEVTLIDTGLWGEDRLVGWLLRKLGLGPQHLRAILLTHGHLDHAGNLHALVSSSGADVYGHEAEQAHVNGVYPYRGVNRLCGWLEAAGRAVLGYRAVSLTHKLSDEDKLPFWGGLRVLHLPGHTAGHCGFYSERHDLLFCGDLFASYFFSVHFMPAFLNSEPASLGSTVARVIALNPRWILPNHYDSGNAELHAARLQRLVRR
jgi:glyoxylase-like metal-dependent hydrolase (beta-lactamase superfamily II)